MHGPSMAESDSEKQSWYPSIIISKDPSKKKKKSKLNSAKALEFPGGSVVRNPPAYARDTGSIPGQEDSTYGRATKPAYHNCGNLHPGAHTPRGGATRVRSPSTTLAREQPLLTTSRESLHAAPKTQRSHK